MQGFNRASCVGDFSSGKSVIGPVVVFGHIQPYMYILNCCGRFKHGSEEEAVD